MNIGIGDKGKILTILKTLFKSITYPPPRIIRQRCQPLLCLCLALITALATETPQAQNECGPSAPVDGVNTVICDSTTYTPGASGGISYRSVNGLALTLNNPQHSSAPTGRGHGVFVESRGDSTEAIAIDAVSFDTFRISQLASAGLYARSFLGDARVTLRDGTIILNRGRTRGAHASCRFPSLNDKCVRRDERRHHRSERGPGYHKWCVRPESWPRQ